MPCEVDYSISSTLIPATPQLKELVRLPVASSWYQLGIQLGFETSKLKDIQSDHEKVKDCLTEMFTQWLKLNPTWQDLIEALEHLGEIQLATEIQNSPGT